MSDAVDFPDPQEEALARARQRVELLENETAEEFGMRLMMERATLRDRDREQQAWHVKKGFTYALFLVAFAYAIGLVVPGPGTTLLGMIVLGVVIAVLVSDSRFRKREDDPFQYRRDW